MYLLAPCVDRGTYGGNEPWGQKEAGVPAHLCSVTASIRVMPTGDGYRYLLNSLVTSDRAAAAARPTASSYLEGQSKAAA